MKLIVNLKLKPLEYQANALMITLKRVNQACNWIASEAFKEKVFRQFNLHKLTYRSVRDTFGLSAQVTVRAIAKVADAYKIDTVVQRKFKPLGGISYDERIISFKADTVSIWTLEGRITIPFVMGEHQRNLFQYREGQVQLVCRKGTFYLNCVCDVPEEAPCSPTDILGVDLGIIELATDSTGESFSGSHVENVRVKHATQSQLLQHKASKQSQSGKRPRKIHALLKRIAGREKAFRKTENHAISKRLVAKAKTLNAGIALENLKGIRKRIEKTVRSKQRSRISGWSFFELRNFVEYKAKRSGVPVFLVDPRNTSRTCSACGHCEKANRVSQSEFVCKQCNLHINADFNAALNIRDRGFVNIPQGSEHVEYTFNAITGLKPSASS